MQRQDTRSEPAESAVSFGKFRLYPTARLLECDGAPIRIGGRALDILILLAEHAGEVVSKRELIARVWSDVTVDEGSLRFHVTVLRKALGDGKSGERYVTNVPGRGYSLVVPVLRSIERRASDGHAPVVGHPRTLPARSAGLVGRDSIIQEITKALSAHRLVTIVGPGGIGKTSVAVAAAHTLSPAFDGQVSFVDLGPLTESRLVPSVVASTLGLMVGSGDGTDSLVAALQDTRLLLILDSCEHVIEPVAVLAETLFKAAPLVHILATSQESLRAEGEHIYRLFPLQCPPEGEGLRASDLLGFSAAQLFVERATAASYGFEVADAEARFVSEICHRLDGIPLALEIVAARIDVFGLRELAARLDDRLLLTVRGRRTAVPRHRTLLAALDWSYELLSEDERVLLRHLAIFTGPFTFDAVPAVTASVEFGSEVIDLLLSLVAKSLVAPAGERRSTGYRLLDTTRAYALAKLVESGERNNLARRHAKYYFGLLERAGTERESRTGMELLSDSSSQIDNVRAALDWAFSPEGDAMLGVELTTEAIPILIHLSLLHECRSRAEQAIAILSVDARPDPRVEMKLQAALGASLLTIGDAVSQIEAPWVRTLHLAEGLGDVDYQLRSLLGMWLLSGQEGLGLAQRFFAVASMPTDRLFGDMMIGVSSHWRGDLITARVHLERVIAQDAGDNLGQRIIRFQGDQRLLSQAFMARTLWLQGFSEQAVLLMRTVVSAARATQHAILTCRALVYAGCPIALWVGDLELTEHNIDLLQEVSTRRGLVLWSAFGKAYRGILCVRRGDLAEGLRLLRGGFDELGTAFVGRRILVFLGELALALGHAGQLSEGLITIEDAIDRSKHGAELWIMAELLRIKGELIAMQGGPECACKAEAVFRQALDWATRQSALSWELRAAASLARLLHDHDRSADAIACLQPIYDRFTEGFATADLRAARTLLGYSC